MSRASLADVTLLGRLGEMGTKSLVATPALLCELDLLQENIERMADVARKGGVALRPHAKSHKSAFIARLQLSAGASGIACAKLAEAEVLVEALVDPEPPSTLSVLITSPLASDASNTRAALLATKCELIIVVDHPDAADELARAVLGSDTVISVLCDVDIGLGRTGVIDANHALHVVERIVQHPNLRFAGIQAYGGHLQHIGDRAQRRTQTDEATQRLAHVIDAIETSGHEVVLRTGGGTGTAGIDIELGLLNELQPGSYVFMDREYRDALGADDEGAFAQSLTIATTVISSNQSGFVTVDAGLKAMSTDAGTPVVIGHAESQYHFFGDEQGLVTTVPERPLHRGDRLELVPPHCDPTVDRYDGIWLIRGDVVVGRIEVDARGCSQ